MPVTLTYPGIYVEEIPSGVRTVTGVATSITAFVGRAPRGPVSQPVTINSYADYERVFGGLSPDSTMGFAVRDFFLNGGGQAVIVRLFRPAFASEEARTAAATAAQEVATAAGAAVAAPGATAATVAAAARTQAGNAANNEEPRLSAADVVADAAEAAAVLPGATPASVQAAADAAVAQAAPIGRARLAVDTLNLEAANEGTWGNALRARVDHDVKPSTSTTLFNLFVHDAGTGVTEVFRNVSVLPDDPRRVDRVLANESRLAAVRGPLPAARPTPNAAPAAGGDPFGTTSSSGVGVAGQATDGGPLTTDDYVGPGTQGGKRGLFALERTELFNLLCVPPYGPNTDVDTTLLNQAAAYCVTRRAMLLIDPPRNRPANNWIDKDSARAGIDSLSDVSRNAAVFFPRLRQPNPLREGQVEEFVPCGAVAGVMARTDAQRGVWKAPAGLEATLVGVPELSVPLTDADNGELNPLGINCLRAMPGAGRVVWGARTRVGDDRLASEWKYVPVRRTALFLEESLYRGTQWVVFEPNDEPLWSQIRLNIGAFMQNLFRQGAFQGRTPREAYFVKCDRETTTQNDINLGIVNILVGFAPLKPAEFVVLRIQQMAGQVEA